MPSLTIMPNAGLSSVHMCCSMLQKCYFLLVFLFLWWFMLVIVISFSFFLQSQYFIVKAQETWEGWHTWVVPILSLTRCRQTVSQNIWSVLAPLRFLRCLVLSD